MSNSKDFFELTNDQVLDALEKALGRESRGVRATGYIMPLNSLENRVYLVDFEDGLKVVAKFYRPHRWSQEQILEEHLFLKSLQENEIPVVAPITLGNATQTLEQTKSGIYFAIFPFVRGRLRDELNDTQLRVLGRYVARIHRIGRSLPIRHRHRIDVATFGEASLHQLVTRKFFETPSVQQQYESIVQQLLNYSKPLLAPQTYILCHGDCHLGNTLWNEDQAFFLDFDDMCFAPAVQDVWMIVRGRDQEAIDQREILIEAYEQMNDFPREQLPCIEALRALRVIHYSAWISQRWEDPAFKRAFPDFGSSRYWQDEISDLYRSLEILQQGGH